MRRFLSVGTLCDIIKSGIFLNTAYQFNLGWDGFSWKEKTNFFFNMGRYLDKEILGKEEPLSIDQKNKKSK